MRTSTSEKGIPSTPWAAIRLTAIQVRREVSLGVAMYHIVWLFGVGCLLGTALPALPPRGIVIGSGILLAIVDSMGFHQILRNGWLPGLPHGATGLTAWQIAPMLVTWALLAWLGFRHILWRLLLGAVGTRAWHRVPEALWLPEPVPMDILYDAPECLIDLEPAASPTSAYHGGREPRASANIRLGIPANRQVDEDKVETAYRNCLAALEADRASLGSSVYQKKLRELYSSRELLLADTVSTDMPAAPGALELAQALYRLSGGKSAHPAWARAIRIWAYLDPARLLSSWRERDWELRGALARLPGARGLAWFPDLYRQPLGYSSNRLVFAFARSVTGEVGVEGLDAAPEAYDVHQEPFFSGF